MARKLSIPVGDGTEKVHVPEEQKSRLQEFIQRTKHRFKDRQEVKLFYRGIEPSVINPIVGRVVA